MVDGGASDRGTGDSANRRSGTDNGARAGGDFSSNSGIQRAAAEAYAPRTTGSGARGAENSNAKGTGNEGTEAALAKGTGTDGTEGAIAKGTGTKGTDDAEAKGTGAKGTDSSDAKGTGAKGTESSDAKGIGVKGTDSSDAKESGTKGTDRTKNANPSSTGKPEGGGADGHDLHYDTASLYKRTDSFGSYKPHNEDKKDGSPGNPDGGTPNQEHGKVVQQPGDGSTPNTREDGADGKTTKSTGQTPSSRTGEGRTPFDGQGHGSTGDGSAPEEDGKTPAENIHRGKTPSTGMTPPDSSNDGRTSGDAPTDTATPKQTNAASSEKGNGTEGSKNPGDESKPSVDTGKMSVKNDGASRNFENSIRNQYNQLPTGVKNTLEKNGVKIAVGQDMTKLDPDHAGEHPPGYDSHDTGADSPAQYRPDNKEIDITEKKGTSNSLPHESGHAIDDVASKTNDPLSDSQGFKDAYAKDRDNLSSAQLKQLNYFTQRGPDGSTGRSETFAQVFSDKVSPTPKNFDGKPVSSYFPNSAIYVNGVLQNLQ